MKNLPHKGLNSDVALGLLMEGKRRTMGSTMQLRKRQDSEVGSENTQGHYQQMMTPQRQENVAMGRPRNSS